MFTAAAGRDSVTVPGWARPHKHRYALSTITTLVCTVVASVTMRAAARAYAIFEGEKMGKRSLSPSYSSVRLWLLRVGVYQLTKAVQNAGDWIYIVDHCVRVGSAKLFVVLGVRLSQLPEDFRLERSQMTVVHIEVMEDANKQNVKAALDKAVARTSVPCQIVSDGGSDIRCGVSLFQEENADVMWSYDIHHKVAAELKALAEADASWGELSTALAQFKVQVQQTDLAALAPPAQRGKARYMNIDVLLSHVRNFILPVFRRPEAYAETLKMPAEELKARLAWINDHRATISLWEQLAIVGEFVRAVVNQYGYGDPAIAILRGKLGPYISAYPHMTAAKLAARLLAFVEEQSRAIPPRQRMLGSTEIIESLFGRLKHLLGEYARNGFTGLVVVLAAIVSTPSQADVMRALSSITTRDALAYVRAVAGVTVQQTRQEIRSVTRQEENPGKRRIAA